MSNEVTLSKKVFLICTAFIAGVLLAPVSFFLATITSLLFYLPLRNFTTTLLCLLALTGGFFSFHYKQYTVPVYLEGPVAARVVEEPLHQSNFTRLTVEHEEGRALLYVDRFAPYQYGDMLVVDGNFNTPEDEGYANYLLKEGIYHTAFRPQISKVGEQQSFFYKAVYTLREKARANIRKNLSPPQSFIAEAVVLGDRTSFSDDFNDQLSISGTRHITAISGMHIVIISTLLATLFSLLKVDKRLAAIFSLLLVALFVVFVGAPPSAVRAGMMGSVGVMGSIFFRQVHSFRLVVLVATLMLIFNPLLLHYDLGFQLSFLAVVGIIALHEPVKKRIPLKKDTLVKDLLAVTVSAQILVTPIIVYNFGHLSLVSVPANIIIVPLLPYIMPFVFAVALTGNFVISLITQAGITVITTVISTASSVPLATVTVYNTPFYLVVVVYGYIFYRIRRAVRW